MAAQIVLPDKRACRKPMCRRGRTFRPSAYAEHVEALPCGCSTAAEPRPTRRAHAAEQAHLLTEACSSPFFSIFSLLFRWLPRMMV